MAFTFLNEYSYFFIRTCFIKVPLALAAVTIALYPHKRQQGYCDSEWC